MSDLVRPGGESPFDRIRRVDERGEYWLARELMPLLGHENWYRFQAAIKRARAAIMEVGHDADQYIARFEIPRRSARALVDYRLTSGGVQMVAIHATFPMVTQCQHCGELIAASRSSRRFCERCLTDNKRPGRAQSRTARSHALRQVGLTLAEYDAMVQARGGLCDICGKRPVSQGGSLCVDHDHDTNAIRGLLCSPCNRALGLLGDTAEAVDRAARYLANHERANSQGQLALVVPPTRRARRDNNDRGAA